MIPAVLDVWKLVTTGMRLAPAISRALQAATVLPTWSTTKEDASSPFFVHSDDICFRLQGLLKLASLVTFLSSWPMKDCSACWQILQSMLGKGGDENVCADIFICVHGYISQSVSQHKYGIYSMFTCAKTSWTVTPLALWDKAPSAPHQHTTAIAAYDGLGRPKPNPCPSGLILGHPEWCPLQQQASPHLWSPSVIKLDAHKPNAHHTPLSDLWPRISWIPSRI